MSDGDLYAGEGVVTVATYGGDLDKAKASGRERARGNLAENIKVRVVSKTTDSQSSANGVSSEKIEAVSSSSADLELENIQYKVLEDYPKAGQLTVLATLSKEDYQRQMDQRVLAFRPLRGLRLWGGMLENQILDSYSQDYGSPPVGLVNSGANQGGANGGASIGFGADFYWHSWFAGAGLSLDSQGLYTYEPTTHLYGHNSNPWSLIQAKAGYEWTPWATRLQVAFPVQLEAAYLSWDPHFASGYGAAGGARFRYWTTDRVAFDVGALWHQGLSESDVATRDGQAALLTPTKPVRFSLTGVEFTVGILWNGF